MRTDSQRWDARYRERDPNRFDSPDPLLVAQRDLLDGRGRALDVACGAGANLIELASRGYEAFGLDGSIEGLRLARRAAERAGIEVHLAAVDLDRFVLPRGWFQVVTVFRYLSRMLVPSLRDALAPGGLLVYRTFNVRHLERRSGFAARFVLQPGELRRWFAGWEIIAVDDAAEPTGSDSWIVCRRAPIR